MAVGAGGASSSATEEGPVRRPETEAPAWDSARVASAGGGTGGGEGEVAGGGKALASRDPPTATSIREAGIRVDGKTAES